MAAGWLAVWLGGSALGSRAAAAYVPGMQTIICMLSKGDIALR